MDDVPHLAWWRSATPVLDDNCIGTSFSVTECLLDQPVKKQEKKKEALSVNALFWTNEGSSPFLNEDEKHIDR